MTYPYRKVKVYPNSKGGYNVVEEVKGRSGKILASFMDKDRAEEFKKKVRL